MITKAALLTNHKTKNYQLKFKIMGARSYPIWNQVTNCKYQGDKSYGNVDTGEVNTYIGSSAKK